MDAITYSLARQNLAKMMTEISEDKKTILITRNKNEDCVLMPLSEYEALQETAYLLRSPKNAQRLIDSIKELSLGKGLEKELIE